MAPAARMQKKTWHIRPPDVNAGQLAEKLKVSPILAQVLINRQITSHTQAQTFLRPKLIDLIEPEKMPGVAEAVKRVKRALAGREKIVIYGDYDVDGITSVSILWHLLELLGADVEFYIPHRVEEGYGLNPNAIEQLAQSGAKLIVTVDCGITALAEAKLAAELGVDMIITDHHRPGEKLPKAAAIVHPSLDDSYSNPDSAGAMVALKLAWAVANEFKTGPDITSRLRTFLLNATTLAAMGTIADVVDLRGENRILTSYGLKALPESELRGIKALIDSADLAGRDLDSYDIAFRLAPMLNAAGRMGHARLAVELLTSDDEMRCTQISQYLKDQNKQRQSHQRKIFAQAREMIMQTGLNHPDRKSIVLAGENWHTGVIGIVASRIIDEFYRPAIMLNTAGQIAQGSARSIAGFDMHACLCACSGHLISFGGHKMAAGLKLHADKIADFTQAVEDYAQKNLTDQALVSKLDIDAHCSIRDLNDRVVKQLSLLEPFGSGNEKPIFATMAVRWISRPKRVGSRGEHLQVAISDNTASVRCIAFGMGKLEKKLLETDLFHVAYEPQLNTWNGNTNVQFVLADIQFE